MPRYEIMGDAAERLLCTLWVGSLWAIGYMAAPTLFATLDDRALAGQVAGRLFNLEAWLSIVCGGLLVAGSAVRAGAGMWRDARFLLPLAMLVLLAGGEFGLGPLLEAARAAGDGARFGLLHGAAAMVYLVASVLGLGLVLIRRPAAG